MSAKKQLGQFFTADTGTVLQGLECFVAGKAVFDPFAGAGDLLRWAIRFGARSVRGCDIDARLTDDDVVFHRDSWAHPPKAKFILTNPPYLYQNKMADNSVLAHSKHTDLYQLSLEKLMESDEGIIIVPVNFLSSENAKYIRRIFLEKFALIKVNYFTEQVFADTSYNVIACYYRKKTEPAEAMTVDFTLYPQQRQTKITLFRRYNWQIGGEFLASVKAQGNLLRINRLEEEDLRSGAHKVRIAYNHLSCRREMSVCAGTYQALKNNIIILKAIDTGTAEGQICVADIRDYGCDALVSIKTSRNQINLVFSPAVSVGQQERLIELFNQELAAKRQQYDSLFMTNYHDKGRKRISFNFAYKLLNYLYYRDIAKQKENAYACAG